MRPDRLILVGRIVGLSGVQGWVKLESYTEPRLGIFAYQPWLLGDADKAKEISGARGRAQGKGLIAALPGIADRAAAAGLVGAEIRVPRSALPAPGPGEYYWTDLEGLEVVTTEGVALGRVSHLFSTGANDVLAVRDEVRQRLIPFVPDRYIQSVNMESGRITVDWDPEF